MPMNVRLHLFLVDHDLLPPAPQRRHELLEERLRRLLHREHHPVRLGKRQQRQARALTMLLRAQQLLLLLLLLGLDPRVCGNRKRQQLRHVRGLATNELLHLADNHSGLAVVLGNKGILEMCRHL